MKAKVKWYAIVAVVAVLTGVAVYLYSTHESRAHRPHKIHRVYRKVHQRGRTVFRLPGRRGTNSTLCTRPSCAITWPR